MPQITTEDFRIMYNKPDLKRRLDRWEVRFNIKGIAIEFNLDYPVIIPGDMSEEDVEEAAINDLRELLRRLSKQVDEGEPE